MTRSKQKMGIGRAHAMVAMVGCLVLCSHVASDVSSATAPPSSILPESTLDVPHLLDMTPEATEVLKSLIRLDRNALKTIDENYNTLFMTFVPSMVLESYNFSAGTSDCATAQSRALSPNILKRSEIVDKKIDETLDKMLRQWDALKSQAEFEAYLVQFWEDRNAIYRFLTHKGESKPCEANIDSESCTTTGLSSMESVFGSVFESLSNCKVKFWQD